MSVIDDVLGTWRRAQVALNPPAEEADLSRLARRIGVPVPPELISLLSVANGMALGEVDGMLTRFWSIDEMVASPIREGQDATGAFRDIPIADVLIDSWRFWLRVRGNGAIGILVAGNGEEIPSVARFFQRYVAEPESLSLLVDGRK